MSPVAIHPDYKGRQSRLLVERARDPHFDTVPRIRLAAQSLDDPRGAGSLHSRNG